MQRDSVYSESGYAMAALLAMMGVMAVLLTAALPVWKTMATREKESELIFRGEQYARAIGLYQRRMGPGTLPPSIDLLVDGKYLRKKYKDPITNDDFQLLSAGQAAAVQAGARGGQGAQNALQQTAGRATFTVGQGGGGAAQGSFTIGQGGPVVGGIIGVASKSTETSLRLYNNRNRYNEWTFVFTQPAQGPGVQRPGEGGINQGQFGPTGRGGRGADGRGPRGGQGGPIGPAGRGAQGQGPRGGANPFGAPQGFPPGGQPQPQPQPQQPRPRIF